MSKVKSFRYSKSFNIYSNTIKLQMCTLTTTGASIYCICFLCDYKGVHKYLDLQDNIFWKSKV